MARIERCHHIESAMQDVAKSMGLERPPGYRYEAYLMNNEVKILISNDADRLHMSVSCQNRLPTWQEVHDARYELLPLGKHFVMALPPPQFYVNTCKYCFHLWEVKEKSLMWIFEQM
jgi:hypothetical protein